MRVGYQEKWNISFINAKVDTGASISLLPKYLVHNLKLKGGIPYTLYGVVRTEDCKVEVELYRINLQLMDYLGRSLVLEDVWIAFTELERTPHLLGYKDVLQRLAINQSKNSQTLELSHR